MSPVSGQLEAQKQEILNVFVDGVCLDLDIGYPRFERNLDAKDVGIKESDIPDIFKLGKKQLVSKKTLGLFASIDAKARREVEFYSLNAPFLKDRFVPFRCISDVEDSLTTLKAEFHKRAEEFVGKYEQIKREMLSTYATHREAIEKLYPAKGEVESAFRFEWRAYSYALPSKIQRKAADLKMSQEAFVKANAIIERKQNQMVNQFDLWAVDIVKDARTAAATLFRTVRDKVAHGEAIHSKTVESLREFIDKFRMMNFVGDADLEKSLAGARGILDAGFDTAFGKKHFLDAANEIVKAAENLSDVSAVTGSYRRRCLES
jgi:hypothetical protein